MKQHDKGNASATAKPAKAATLPPEKPVEKPVVLLLLFLLFCVLIF